LAKIGKIANEKKRTNKRAREIRKEERRVGEKGKTWCCSSPFAAADSQKLFSLPVSFESFTSRFILVP
jgi:hypothetical protein